MKYKLVKQSELEELLATARRVKRDERDEIYERAYEDGKAEQAAEVEELQGTVDEQKATLKSKNRKIAEIETELEVLRKERKDAREIVTKRLANENVAEDLNAREELLKKREAKVAAREEAVKTEEDETDNKRYKEGYADGVADGVRKIGEITQEDRNNAMDVAKISAASHSQPETVKAVLDAATTSTKKAK